MEAVCPERARVILEVAEAARDRAKLRQEKWRVHALLALVAAAHTTGLNPRAYEAELDRLLVPQGSCPFGVELARLLREPELDQVETRQRAWRAYRSTWRPRRPLVLVELLVTLGRVDEARSWAARLPAASGLRRSASRLIRLGLVGFGQDERFVGRGGANTLLAHFEPTLGLIAAAAAHPDSRNAESLERLRQAARKLAPKACQLSLVELAPLAWAIGGERLAASFANAPRYANLRRRAWERVHAAQVEPIAAEERPRATAQAPDHARAQCLVRRALAGARACLASTAPLSDLERGVRGLELRRGGDRAAYDEGLALGPRRGRHAQALVRACGAELRRALEDGTTSPRTQTRRRTLRWIGGERAKRRWIELLTRSPHRGPLSTALLADLAEVDPPAATRCLRMRARDWLAGRDRGAEAIRVLERSGACSPDLPQAWINLVDLAEEHIPDRAIDWIADLIAPSLRAASVLPKFDALIGISRGLASGRIDRQALDRPATELIPALRAKRKSKQRRPMRELVDHVCSSDEAYITMAMWSSVTFPERWTSWHRQTLERALTEIPPADATTERHAKGMFGSSSSKTGPVPIGDHHRIRRLHAEDDLVTLLRFADWANCCWNSDHGWWKGNARHVLRQILDPLSFVYHLEYRAGPSAPWRPRGFIMGGLALGTEGERLAVLNGLYLKRAGADLRAASLHALESDLAATYSALNGIGIACAHGGYGPLPEDYERWDKRTIRRLRALDESPRRIGDDIGGTANAWADVSYLHWKPMTQPPSTAIV